jgi:hypothetical protein
MTGATLGKVSISQYENLLLNQRVGIIRPNKNELLILINTKTQNYSIKKSKI